MLISERIYKYLAERGMTQLEFSQKTGISQSTISDWKRKGTNPSADKILIICDVLSITPYELLAGTENPRMKEYVQTDYVTLDKNSQEYALVEIYQRLDVSARRRLEGYIQALSDMNDMNK